MIIVPKLFVNNRQKSFAHLLKRELYWAWYAQLCKWQHQPIMESSIELEIIKPNGKIADKIKVRGETKVRNYDNFIAQNMLGIQPSTYSMGAYGEGSLVMKDTAGTDRTTQAKWTATDDIEALNLRGLRRGAGYSDWGIIFDQSDAIWTYEQTVGVTPVANGTGANQLVYGDTFLPNYSYDDVSKMTSYWERMALNNTAGQTSVDIKGICLYGYLVNYGATYIHMLARDVLPATITLAYQEQIKGRWTLQHDRNA